MFQQLYAVGILNNSVIQMYCDQQTPVAVVLIYSILNVIYPFTLRTTHVFICTCAGPSKHTDIIICLPNCRGQLDPKVLNYWGSGSEPRGLGTYEPQLISNPEYEYL